MKHRLLTAGIAALAASISCAAQQAPAPAAPTPATPAPPPLHMTLPGIPDGGTIPTKFTCSATGGAVSPEIRWSQVPAGTQSFVMVMHDLDPHPAKGLMDNPHWIVWNIPGTATELPEGVPAGSPLPDGTHQMKRTRTTPGSFYSYYPPCAPPGPNHHYVWELYALDTKLDLPVDATRADILKAVDGHVLAASSWFGFFHR